MNGSVTSDHPFPVCKRIGLSAGQCGEVSECRGGYEILFAETGCVRICVNGKTSVLSENEMFIVTPAQYYRFADCSDKCVLLSLSFSPSLACAAFHATVPAIFHGDAENGVFSARFTEKCGVKGLLTQALGDKSHAGELACSAAALRVLLEAVKTELIYDPDALSSKGISEKLGFIADEVKNNAAGCNEKELAEKCGVSYSYFSRSFKSAMGMSFNEYVNFIRINEAKRLLADANRDMAALAERLGYSSASHFINVFKKTEGISPKQYGRSLSEKAE